MTITDEQLARALFNIVMRGMRQNPGAVHEVVEAAKIPALLGMPTGTSTWTYTPPGFSGWKYVRLVDGESGGTVAKALNTAGVSDTGDLKIWVVRNADDQLEIVSERRQGLS